MVFNSTRFRGPVAPLQSAWKQTAILGTSCPTSTVETPAGHICGALRPSSSAADPFAEACLPLCLFESIFSLTLQLILLTDGPFHTALYAGTASILTLSRTCAAAVLLYSPRLRSLGRENVGRASTLHSNA